MEVSLARRIVAEMVGTGILVLFGAGSVVAALRLGGGELDYAGLGANPRALSSNDVNLRAVPLI